MSDANADLEQGQTVRLERTALKLDCGASLAHVDIAYRTYGTLNKDKSNAILICHALTGDQHPAGDNPLTDKEGWWTQIVGPGSIIDTDKYFVICSNVLGGCGGSTGPQSDKPDGSGLTGWIFRSSPRRYGAQNLLIDHLGIETLFCVLGGSMGGMQICNGRRRMASRFFRPCQLPPQRAIHVKYRFLRSRPTSHFG